MRRKLWMLALIALLQPLLSVYDVGTPFDFGPPGVASAQTGPGVACLNNACVNDPCALYPHQYATLPTSGASPTALLISGISGQQTYICGYEFTMSGSSPTLVVSTGQASNSGASPTPCATGTIGFTAGGYKSTLAIFGGPGAGSLAGAGDAWVQSPGDGQHTMLGPWPPVASATTGAAQTWDICVQNCTSTTACGASNVQGHLEYVQH